MAEREGFEPSVGVNLRRFSKPLPSTTRPPLRFLMYDIYGGEGGIRTHGPVKDCGFQDRPIRPLSHLSYRPTIRSIPPI